MFYLKLWWKNPSHLSSSRISVSVVSCWFVFNLVRNGYECLSYIIACHSLLLESCSIWKMCLAPCRISQTKIGFHFYSHGLFTVIMSVLLCCLLVRKSKCWHTTDSIALVFKKYKYCMQLKKKNRNRTSCYLELNILFRIHFNSFTLSLF